MRRTQRKSASSWTTEKSTNRWSKTTTHSPILEKHLKIWGTRRSSQSSTSVGSTITSELQRKTSARRHSKLRLLRITSKIPREPRKLYGQLVNCYGKHAERGHPSLKDCTWISQPNGIEVLFLKGVKDKIWGATNKDLRMASWSRMNLHWPFKNHGN